MARQNATYFASAMHGLQPLFYIIGKQWVNTISFHEGGQAITGFLVDECQIGLCSRCFVCGESWVG